MPTKSDWFVLTTSFGPMQLEVFGVNPDKGTTHCMRLLTAGLEAELVVFHLQDFYYVTRQYGITKMTISSETGKIIVDWTKDNLIKYSEQLKAEGKGIVRPETKRLTHILQKRRENYLKDNF